MDNLRLMSELSERHFRAISQSAFAMGRAINEGVPTQEAAELQHGLYLTSMVFAMADVIRAVDTRGIREVVEKLRPDLVEFVDRAQKVVSFLEEFDAEA